MRTTDGEVVDGVRRMTADETKQWIEETLKKLRSLSTDDVKIVRVTLG